MARGKEAADEARDKGHKDATAPLAVSTANRAMPQDACIHDTIALGSLTRGNTPISDSPAVSAHSESSPKIYLDAVIVGKRPEKRKSSVAPIDLQLLGGGILVRRPVASVM